MILIYQIQIPAAIIINGNKIFYNLKLYAYFAFNQFALKQLTAILFLVVHLFNIAAYRLAFSIAESKANKQMITSLDNNNYNESDLIQIKLALNAPYIQGSCSYERYDGEVEYNGVQYNYVKRMISNDTLYLYCIPNKEKTDINNTKNLYVKQNADNTSGKTSEQPALKKVSFLSEYNSDALSFNFDAHKFSSGQVSAFNDLTTLKGFVTKHLQPPDLFI
jgi:hypothetical protein